MLLVQPLLCYLPRREDASESMRVLGRIIPSLRIVLEQEERARRGMQVRQEMEILQGERVLP